MEDSQGRGAGRWISLYPKGNAMGEWDTNGETLKLIDPDSESDDESLPF